MNNKGNHLKYAFTLIELLVVIAIIGILSGLIITTMSGATESARIAKLKVYSNSVRDTLGANLVSEWKLDQIVGSSAPYTTLDTWGTNIGTLMDIDGACSFSSSYKCPQLVIGCPSGNCLSFDGTNDHIHMGSSTLYLSSKFTISVWANAGVKSWHYVLGNSTYVANNAFSIVKASGGYGIYYDVNAGEPRSISSYVTDVNTWNNIVATYDNTVIKIYVDGILKNSVARVGTGFPGGDLVIGDQHTNSAIDRPWLGSIDDIRIYNEVATTLQIQEIYLAGLNKLLSNGGIDKNEYDQRLSEFNKSTASAE